MRTFQIRRSASAGDASDAVRFEIEHVAAERRRVFMVIDLSDSARGITAQLGSLGFLWRLLPAQWTVSLCALSPSLELPIRDATTAAGDIGKAFDEIRDLSPNNCKELRAHAARGTFLGPTLAAIERRRIDEVAKGDSASLPAIIFVVTDGELLDSRPVKPMSDAEVIGILVDSGCKRPSRWRAVVPGSPCFTASDTALPDHIKGLISPNARKCTITLSLSPGEPPAVHQWDFAAKGKYELDLPNGSSLSDDAFIECWSQSGDAIKWPVRSLLQGEMDELLSGVIHAAPATVASGLLHEITDESLIHALREHAAAQQSEQCSWDADIVNALAAHVTASVGDRTAVVGRPRGLLAVFCKREAGTSADISGEASARKVRLLLGFLYNDRSKSMYIPRAPATPTDPGFRGKEDVRVLWDNNELRFAVLCGDRPRRDLRPHECETFEYFIDVDGNDCTAFYSGYIDWP
jgi:hypothetical protein